MTITTPEPAAIAETRLSHEMASSRYVPASTFQDLRVTSEPTGIA